MRHALPIVAIVGRPNVGKSTLFNRFAGARRALVEDRPGITRDRIADEIEVSGRRVLVVDTAGLDPEAEQGLSAAVQAQAQAAIQDADAILFLTDGQSGVLPEDQSIAKTLRRTDKPIALLVNKIDVPAHAARVGEFHALGFTRTRGVSAEHGTGAWDALEELVAELPQVADVGAPPATPGIRIAVVGRPNVGKSSLVNRLCGETRMVVSDVPGTTRDAVDVRLERDGEVYTLVDTAGLRRAGRRDREAERGSAVMTVRALERAEVALVLVDSSEGFTDQDARVASLARERGCSVAVLANKWDLVEKDRGEEVARGIAHGLRFMADAPVLRISAKTGSGIGRIFERVRRIHEAAQRRIGTAELNRWLQEAVRLHEPAMAQRGTRRRPLKFFYATQTATRPPTFVLFCTEPESVQPAYRRFLEKRLRETFDLEGTPVRLRLRPRHEGRER
ncbi:MAG TPA: ribosome biogenesis GTPase Der [Myxococcota bacterium]|nr:ribosome biogenesis GTPase Der [Myxococcota bacterium]